MPSCTTNTTPGAHEHTLLHLWALTVPGKHMDRADLTCILRLQVEEPSERQPLHLPRGQNIIPEKRNKRRPLEDRGYI